MFRRVRPGAAPGSAFLAQTLKKPLRKGKLKGALARAFKARRSPFRTDLGERIEAALRRAFTDRLGLELRAATAARDRPYRRAGARSGAVTWLGHASDAAY
jgi:hypothetical protein